MSITLNGDYSDRPPTRPGVKCQCGHLHVLDKSRIGRERQCICPKCRSALWYEKDGKAYAVRSDQDKPMEIECVELKA